MYQRKRIECPRCKQEKLCRVKPMNYPEPVCSSCLKELRKEFFDNLLKYLDE